MAAIRAEIRAEMHEEEIDRFNKIQNAKIISIRQKRMEKEKARKLALHRFMGMLQSIAIVLFIAVLFTSYVYKNSLVNEAKYDINNLKAEIKSLNAQIEEYNAKIENQTGLKNIEKIAVETLGMQYPTPEQMVYIESTAHYALLSDSPEIIVEPVKNSQNTPMVKELFAALLGSKND